MSSTPIFDQLAAEFFASHKVTIASLMTPTKGVSLKRETARPTHVEASYSKTQADVIEEFLTPVKVQSLFVKQEMQHQE